MRDDEPIGVDDRDLDDATLVALAEAHATPPPSDLRSRVLAAARTGGRRGDASPIAAHGTVSPRWRLIGAIAAAAAVAFAALAAQQWRLASDRAVRIAEIERTAGERTTQLAAVARANDELNARLDEQGRTLAGLREAVAAQAQVLQVLAGPRTVTAALTPKDGGEGTGRVVVDPASGEGAVVLAGLPALGADRAYELWTIRGDRPPEPAGVFTVEPGRPLAARVASVPRADEVTAFAVSVEPAAGSASPTGPIVLIGPVAS
jgi:anti-sigma-K factor RskA